MSVYSTINITRQRALELIRARLENATDRVVEEILFELLQEETLHNYRITPDGDGRFEP